MDTQFQPKLHLYPILDSTNTKAKELAMEGAPHGTVVIARQQSAGRGRMHRNFFSPPGCGIYLSALIRPKEAGLSTDDTILLTTAASVAVARAVSQVLHKELQIKWVNDLYFHKKKVCGILTEGVFLPRQPFMDAVIVGIGVNYRQPENGFPADIKDIAGALLSAREPAPPIDRLSEAIASHLFAMLPQVKDRTFLEEYRQRSLLLGRTLRLFPRGAAGDHPDLSGDGFHIARALDIAPDGGLIVQYEDGSRETLTTGEVSIRPLQEGGFYDE